jgi:hypothetical protein
MQGSPKAAAITMASATDLEYKSGAMDVKPLYRIAGEKDAVYWQV